MMRAAVTTQPPSGRCAPVLELMLDVADVVLEAGESSLFDQAKRLQLQCRWVFTDVVQLRHHSVHEAEVAGDNKRERRQTSRAVKSLLYHVLPLCASRCDEKEGKKMRMSRKAMIFHAHVNLPMPRQLIFYCRSQFLFS